MVSSATSPLSALTILLLLATPLSAAPLYTKSRAASRITTARTSKATPSGVPTKPSILPISAVIDLVGATTHRTESTLGKAVLGTANGLIPGLLQPRQLGFLGAFVPNLLSAINGVVSGALGPSAPAGPTTSLSTSPTSLVSSSDLPSSVSSILSSVAPVTTPTATPSTTFSTSTAPTTTSASPPAITSSPSIACLDSSNNETTINALFFYGGAGTTVYLCPSAVILIYNPIFFFFANQTLITLGSPTDPTRARIQVAGSSQSCAIFGAFDACSNIALRNVQIEGSRETLGWMSDGIGLIEFGGSTKGQVIDSVAARNPRGWTAMHIIEGSSSNWCSGSTITNNDIGPAGHAPSGARQFRRDTVTYTPGQWADGISLACTNSLVSGNTITDATDGGIVIFQAPGSKITSNTIISKERQLLGGINAVDFSPFNGNYAGTVVDSNTIIAESNFIKIGLAIGPLSWGSFNSPTFRNTGGVFTNNLFKSGATGYFGYGVSVAAQLVAQVSGNRFLNANFGGIITPACIGPPYVPPTPGPLYQDPLTTTGTTYQSDFLMANIAFLICLGPSAIQRAGYTT